MYKRQTPADALVQPQELVTDDQGNATPRVWTLGAVGDQELLVVVDWTPLPKESCERIRMVTVSPATVRRPTGSTSTTRAMLPGRALASTVADAALSESAETVRNCVPASGPSVHRARAVPVASVVATVGADSPPDSAVKRTADRDTALP